MTKFALNINVFKLGFKNLIRDFKAGELYLLFASVILAVCALTSVSFFSDRLQGALSRDAKSLLGGDLVVTSDKTPLNIWKEKAVEMGLNQVENITLPTMLRFNDEAKLINLKAVTNGYPLRGNFRIADSHNDLIGLKANNIPEVSKAWIDNQLYNLMGLEIGSKIWLGDKEFIVEKFIANEPDKSAGFAGFSPRVLINEKDLKETNLIAPASRAVYKLQLSSDNQELISEYETWANNIIKEQNTRGVNIETLENAQPQMKQTLERANKFLNLVALLAALLSSVAVAIAARGFANRHLDACAIFRVLGLSQRQIALSYFIEFAICGLLASIIGVIFGYLLHYIFIWILGGLFDSNLPSASIFPILFGLGVGLTLLAAFGIPPVLQLAGVSPIRVLRRDMGAPKAASIFVLILGAVGFAALLFVSSADLWLGFLTVAGFAGAIIIFTVLSLIAVQILKIIVNKDSAPRWLILATRQISSKPIYSALQITSLATGLMALVLLTLLRIDLIDSWRAATPADAPNRFIINIMPDESDAFQAQLDNAGIVKRDYYPMFRGRLISVNEKEITSTTYTEQRAKNLAEREFNLSYSDKLPYYNELLSGSWQSQADGVSVEEGIANTLGLKMGDILGFDIAGEEVSAKITSIRKVDWASMHVNFFVMFTKSNMPDMPITYITAFHEGDENSSLDNKLVNEFQGITIINMSSTLAQLQRILGQVISAVEFLFLFTLAAGILVLFSAISAQAAERKKEFAIMRSFGASTILLNKIQRTELLSVGALAGILASIAATSMAWIMAKYIFEFDWNINFVTIIFGAIAGAILALIAGHFALNQVVKAPVMNTLRNSE